MRVLVVRQPWAHAIIHGLKRVENRSWRTDYTGPVIVQASARIWSEDVEGCEAMGLGVWPGCPLGGVIGMVTLLGCTRASRLRGAVPGEWHWELADPTPLPFRAVRGQLGLYAPSTELAAWVASVMPAAAMASRPSM